jgi:hypothetical protein
MKEILYRSMVEVPRSDLLILMFGLVVPERKAKRRSEKKAGARELWKLIEDFPIPNKFLVAYIKLLQSTKSPPTQHTTHHLLLLCVIVLQSLYDFTHRLKVSFNQHPISFSHAAWLPGRLFFVVSLINSSNSCSL